MSKIKGKRLLVLGGKSIMVDLVNKAKELGVYTIVTDNRPYENSPAKKIADKYYNISFADIDDVIELIKKETIDGVLTGYTDSYLEYYYEICSKAGLPCYGNMNQFAVSTDKVKFKNMCRENGVSDIPGGFAYCYEEAKQIISNINYPIMLKPADNSGSRGVIKCSCEEELQEAFEYAMSFSAIKCVICEKYLDCDNIGASYQLANGEIHLTSVSDRHIYKTNTNGSSITKDLCYPSIYTERYVNEVNEKFIQMLTKNGFREGMLSIQAFVDEKDFYFCEMCYRPSGGHHYSIVKSQTNVDGMGMLIEYALNGKVDSLCCVSPFFDEVCGMINIIGQPNEIIASMEGIEAIAKLDCVIEITQSLFPNDVIGEDGTTAQILCHVLCRAYSFNELHQITEKIKHMLSCKNAAGYDLVKDTQYYV